MRSLHLGEPRRIHFAIFAPLRDETSLGSLERDSSVFSTTSWVRSVYFGYDREGTGTRPSKGRILLCQPISVRSLAPLCETSLGSLGRDNAVFSITSWVRSVFLVVFVRAAGCYTTYAIFAPLRDKDFGNFSVFRSLLRSFRIFSLYRVRIRCFLDRNYLLVPPGDSQSERASSVHGGGRASRSVTLQSTAFEEMREVPY
jgi:hypothetical protein